MNNRLALLPDKDATGLDVQRSLSVGEAAGNEPKVAPPHAFHEHETIRSRRQSEISMRRPLVHCQNKSSVG